jgi:hypothetical protein
MKRKGSLRRILPETKKQIAGYVLKSENKEKTRAILADELEVLLGEKAPSLDTLMRMISRIRNDTNLLDTPWHLGTLEDYPLPPEAIVKIFELRIKTKWDDMTIREAKWVGRLYLLPSSLDMLRMESSLYAASELISELSDTDFDTSGPDKDLAKILQIPDFAQASLFKDDSDLTDRERTDIAAAWGVLGKDFGHWLADYEKTHDMNKANNLLRKGKPETQEDLIRLLFVEFCLEKGKTKEGGK